MFTIPPPIETPKIIEVIPEPESVVEGLTVMGKTLAEAAFKVVSWPFKQVWKALGWLNTKKAYILGGALIVFGIYMFMLEWRYTRARLTCTVTNENTQDDRIRVQRMADFGAMDIQAVMAVRYGINKEEEKEKHADIFSHTIKHMEYKEKPDKEMKRSVIKSYAKWTHQQDPQSNQTELKQNNDAQNEERDIQSILTMSFGSCKINQWEEVRDNLLKHDERMHFKESSASEKRRLEKIEQEFQIKEEPAFIDPEKSYLKNTQEISYDNFTSPIVSKITFYEPAMTTISKLKYPTLETDEKAVRTGPRIQTLKGKAFSYSINHNNPHNQISAFTDRHAAVKCKPNRRIKRLMIKYFHTIWKHKQDYALDINNIVDFEPYMLEHPQWSITKKKKYREAYEHFKNWKTDRETFDYDDKQNQNVLEAHVKSAEENAGFMENGASVAETLKKLKARPRNIGAMKAEYLWVHWLQASLLKQQKKTYPDFGYKGTTTDYEKLFDERLPGIDNKDTTCISTDVSSFDSLQFDWLMDMIDRPYWEKACETFAKKYDWWTPEHTRITIETACSTKVRMVYAWKGLRLFDVIISGTTPSGHGPKTTDGNTKRNRFIQDFILWMAGIPRERIIRKIVGDDFWMRIATADYKAWWHTAKSLYLMTNVDEEYGTGWICKMINVQDGKQARFDFCSKTTMDSCGKAIMTRDFSKYFMNGRYYNGTSRKILSRPELHTHAVNCSNLEFFADVPYLQDRHTGKMNLTPREEKQIEKYMKDHTTWKVTSQSYHRRYVDIFSEIQLYFKWKHGKNIPKEDIISLVMQFRAGGTVTVVNETLLSCLVGSNKMQNQNRRRRPVRKAAAGTNKLAVVLQTMVQEAVKRGVQGRGRQQQGQIRKIRYGSARGWTDKANRKSQKKDALVKTAQKAKEQLTQDELEYLQCVLDPSLYTAKIPSIFGVPSAICQAKGTIYYTVPGQTFAFQLMPWSDSQIGGYSTAITEAGALNSVAWNYNVVGPLSSSNANLRRVVGAYLKLNVLAPDMTRSGLISIGNTPTIANTYTMDGFRDQPNVQTVNCVSQTSAKAIMLPHDPSYLIYGNVGVGPNNIQPTILATLTGYPAGATVSVSYRVVYEFIPTSAYTDLIPPTRPAVTTKDIGNLVGKVSQHVSEGKSMFNDMLDVGGAIVGALGTVTSLFSKL